MAIQDEPWEVHLNALMAELDDSFRPLRYFPSTSPCGFKLCCTSALAKCIDFNSLLSRASTDESCNFLSTSMRSMCEELIVLTSLGKASVEDADKIIGLSMAYEIAEKLTTQDAFFGRYRRQQKVLHPNYFKTSKESLRDQLKAAWNAIGHDVRGKWAVCPTTRSLSRSVGLEVIYDYFFNFSSATVHFSPQQLFRSGWGPIGQDFWFSSGHMSTYFYQIDRTYGAILLAHFLIKFAPILSLPKDIAALKTRLVDFLNRINNWPEIVTFEEMNIKRPEEHNMFLKAVLSQLAEPLWPV